MKRCQTRERSCSSNRQRGVRSNYQGRRWREGGGRKQQPSHLNLPQGGPSVGRRISRDNLKTGDTRKWEGGSLESSSSTLSVKLLKGFRRLDTEISLSLSLPLSLRIYPLVPTLCLIYETSRRRFRNFMQTNRWRIERVSVSQNAGSWTAIQARGRTLKVRVDDSLFRTFEKSFSNGYKKEKGKASVR